MKFRCRSEIESLGPCESTQDLAFAAASKQAAIEPGEGLALHWVESQEQLSGRGRQGRQWLQSEGCLALSVAFRWPLKTPPSAFVSLLAGASLFRSLPAALSENFALKWPNDLLLMTSDTPSKVAGILSEYKKGILCVGWGVNVLSAPSGISGQHTASLLDAGVKITPQQLRELIVGFFEEDLVCELQGERQELLCFLREKAMASLWGKRFSINAGTEHVTALGLEDGGELKVKDHAGKIRIITQAELTPC